MKASPLRLLPELHRLARTMAGMYSSSSSTTTTNNDEPPVNYWNIGVEAIYYRDGKDRMGLHADDDQGEELILAVLLSSPGGPRKVRIQNKVPKGAKATAGDEQIELLLEAGDAYDMDGASERYRNSRRLWT